MNIFTKSVDSILSFVVKNQGFLSKNPKQLALLMKEYSDLFTFSRYHTNKKNHLNQNPKYAILDLEKTTSKKYMELVYDAWAFTCFLDEKTNHPLDKKFNKTPDEFVAMYLDPTYKYYGLFKDRKKILNHLLFSIGNGYDWSDGFLNDANLPNGTSPVVFDGFLEENVSNEVNSICNWKSNKDVEECKNKMIRSRLIKEKEEIELSKKMKEMELFLKKNSQDDSSQFSKKEDQVFVFNEISSYSNIATIPKNTQLSWIKVCIEVCDLILSNEKESENNKTQAKKIKRKLSKLK